MMRTASTGWTGQADGLGIYQAGLTGVRDCSSQLGDRSQQDGWWATVRETRPVLARENSQAGQAKEVGLDKTAETSTSVRPPAAVVRPTHLNHPPYGTSCWAQTHLKTIMKNYCKRWKFFEEETGGRNGRNNQRLSQVRRRSYNDTLSGLFLTCNINQILRNQNRLIIRVKAGEIRRGGL